MNGRVCGCERREDDGVRGGTRMVCVGVFHMLLYIHKRPQGQSETLHSGHPQTYQASLDMSPSTYWT